MSLSEPRNGKRREEGFLREIGGALAPFYPTPNSGGALWKEDIVLHVVSRGALRKTAGACDDGSIRGLVRVWRLGAGYCSRTRAQ